MSESPCDCEDCRRQSIQQSKTEAPFKQVGFAHLLHRKVNQKFLNDLRELHPQFHFEIVGLTERPTYMMKNIGQKKDPYRVVIFVDSEGIIVSMPSNG